MTELPKASFKTIKDKKGKKIKFYKDVLQITVRTSVILIALDGTNGETKYKKNKCAYWADKLNCKVEKLPRKTPEEISLIENIDQLMDPEKSANSGFSLISFRNDTCEEKVDT